MLYQAQRQTVKTTQSDGTLKIEIPAQTPTNLYQLSVGDGATESSQSQPVAVLAPGASGNLSLFSPRHRSIFRGDEAIEIVAVLRARQSLAAGKIRFSLARREGESLAWQDGAAACGEYSLAGGRQAETLSFFADAKTLYPGRYLLQSEYQPALLRSDSSGGQSWRDAWPLEIELQESLRNGLPMQRDIWGSHDLPDWSYGSDLAIAADNRRALVDAVAARVAVVAGASLSHVGINR